MVFLPTDLLPRSLLASVARTPLAVVRRRVRRAAGSRRGARYVEGLGSNAHYNDRLLDSTVAADVVRYRRGAVEFIEILSQALDEAGRSWASIRTCLDAACGYGRMIRELRYEVPPDAISVCDADDEEGAAFTAAEFGVRKVATIEKMGLQFENAFHLVYLASVYTRLDRAKIAASLAKLAAILRPGGVLVFTTLGASDEHGAELPGKARLAFEREGFFHARLAEGPSGPGLTLVTPEAMTCLVAAAAPSLTLVSHRARAFEEREDVFVYRKA